MKRKNILFAVIVTAVFLIQLWRGFAPPPPPAPGEIPGGALPATDVVLFAAFLSGLTVWLLLEILFLAYEEIRGKMKKRKENRYEKD